MQKSKGSRLMCSLLIVSKLSVLSRTIIIQDNTEIVRIACVTYDYVRRISGRSKHRYNIIHPTTKMLRGSLGSPNRDNEKHTRGSGL